jgi:hypothetical protein
MTSASQFTASLRSILKDYNFWPASESDSPLSVKVTKSILDESKVKALDASLRRRAHAEDAAYRIPSQSVRSIPLCSLFRPLIDLAFDNLAAAHFDFESSGSHLASLTLAAQHLEFLLQLFSAFSGLERALAWEISADSEPTVTLVIAGWMGAGPDFRTIYTTATLVRT